MLADYGIFESPETVAIALGLLLFIVAFVVLSRFFGKGNKTAAAMVGLILGGLASWKIYTTNLSYNEEYLFYAFVILAVAIVGAIIWPFIRSWTRR